MNQDDSKPFSQSMKTLRYTYDKEADAAYFYLRDIASGEVADTHACEGLPASVRGEIDLDFDGDGKLLGVEVLSASTILGEEYTRSA